MTKNNTYSELNTTQTKVDNLETIADSANSEKTVTDNPDTVSYVGKGKGSNPNSKKNLMLVKTSEEARERGRNGGIKSGEVRRQRKTMKETILAMLSQEITPEQMEQYGLDKAMLNGDNTMQGAIIASMLREALNGSEKAALLLRDTINEAPVTRSEVVQEVITKEDVQMIENVRKELLSS